MKRAVYQDLSLFSVPNDFRTRGKALTQLWWIVQGTIFKWSPQFMYGFRVWLLRCFGAKIGAGVLIRPSARVTYPWNLCVGNRSWIGDDTVIYNLAEVKIGSDVAIAHSVYLCTGRHDVESIAFDIQAEGIEIGDEVWLANDVFVAAGKRVGRGCVVGARSTVLHDMPEGMICFGSPCVPVRLRTIKGSGVRRTTAVETLENAGS